VWRRLWALIQKELIQLTRDRKMLIGIPLMPLITLVLFATAVHTDIKHIPMVVADQSKSPLSRFYINAFITSGAFNIIADVSNEREVRQFIDCGKAKIGLVIPPNFAKKAEKEGVTVLMLIDGSASYTTQTAYNAASAVSQQVARELLNRSILFPLSTHIQILYNPDMKDLWFVTPAFIALLVQVAAMNMTSWIVVRERESGTIEAILVTPIQPIEFMLGKMLPSLIITFCVGIFLTGFSVFILGLPFLGNFWLFCLLSSVSAFCGLGLGLVISTAVQTMNQSVQLTSMVNVACMFLGGVLFPVYSMPLPLRLIGTIIPATYSVPIMRGLLLKGNGIADLWEQIIALMVVAVGTIWLASSLFKQSLD
jgi:ABC-2 type transport system permease protein